MKKIYTYSIILLLLASASCSKDILKKYDKRIIGTWHIVDVDRYGLGGDTDNLPFSEGSFTFYDNGTLSYVNATNTTFQGNWDIIKKTIDEEPLHGLKVTAVDFTGMQVLSEYYDDMNFTGTDRFNARIVSGLHTYVTRFRR